MLPPALAELVTGPWGLLLLALLVFGDAFLVVIPGEIAVTALGSLAVSHRMPWMLVAVVAVASAAALCGDICCYLLGRWGGTQRWRWMRRERVRRALDWARQRLDRNTAAVLFTARFVPFARLAVNLTAGATRIAPGRYLPLAALAACGWATYQAVMGAAVALIVPGGPVVTVALSIVVAIGVGILIDIIVSRRRGTSAR